MSDRPTQALYTRRAKLYKRFFLDFLQWEKVLETFFQENHYLQPGMKVLDAGCGTGSVTKSLYRLARVEQVEDITFHGFDLTPAMLALFQEWVMQEAAENVKLHQADVLELENQLPAGWNDYDLIVSSTMMEYIPREKLDVAFTNLRRILNHKGRLLLFITRRTWITKLTGTMWWRINPFDLEEIENYLQQAGLAVLDIKKLPAFWSSYIFAVEAS